MFDAIYAQKWPILASLLLVYFARKLYIYQRLSYFKGPWGSGFTEFPHSRRLITEAYTWYEEACEKYGTYWDTANFKHHTPSDFRP